MQTTHRHQKDSETIGGYMWPVGTDSAGYYRSNPAAHGWTTLVAECRCGAVRYTNENQGHVERGRWQEAAI